MPSPLRCIAVICAYRPTSVLAYKAYKTTLYFTHEVLQITEIILRKIVDCAFMASAGYEGETPS